MAQSEMRGLSFDDFRNEVLNDFKVANLSRQLSYVGRKEVLGGKAKFGVFGDGKEVAQIACAKQFKIGDWRSGYYRDQTFLLAAGMTSLDEFFALLYGETRTELNPDNGGRSFNNHFGTRIINDDGTWKELSKMKCTASDISPTAGQMPRLVGLAWASKLYRNNPALHEFSQFSNHGNEVGFGTIGDGSTSEGHFFETMNAAGVLQIPMAVSVWDDGYAISTPKKFQTIKESISKALKGFEKGPKDKTGILIYNVKGWDYPALCQMYEEGITKCREQHVPVLFHVEELTQPFGHTTSGSHERYKSAERLQWENDFDCIAMMRKWILSINLATEEELVEIENQAIKEVKEARLRVFKQFNKALEDERRELFEIISKKSCVCDEFKESKIQEYANELKNEIALTRRIILGTARRVLRHICTSCEGKGAMRDELRIWVKQYLQQNHSNYSDRLYSEDEFAAVKVKEIKPTFDDDCDSVPGREILRDNYHFLFAHYPKLLMFGEDVGKLGGVNQTLEGIQDKFGDMRLKDTGIRETTILGKAIGLSLRGLRPIAEIQYFDYLLYALQTMSDDLATTRYRTKGGQKAPVIISTRGHRLEGIWHSGSPLSMVINSIRGIYVCVPRDMTRAAGFYNTLLKADDPGLVIEPLNGYRIREPRPNNIGKFCVPLGIPEIIQHGTDVTLVTYGSCVRIAHEAITQLNEIGISVELIDVQTLLPFDIHHSIVESVKKTNRVVFFDEDVPGGATAFMMQKVIEEQGAYEFLDAHPVTITAKDHRPAYGTDGDYFSNPSAEDVFETIYELMAESHPSRFPAIY